MDRIPILQMGEFLLVTIQIDMHDQLALTLQEDLTTKIEKTGAHGVLIDISALEMVDSFIGRMIANISGMARILDAHTVIVGMKGIHSESLIVSTSSGKNLHCPIIVRRISHLAFRPLPPGGFGSGESQERQAKLTERMGN